MRLHTNLQGPSKEGPVSLGIQKPLFVDDRAMHRLGP